MESSPPPPLLNVIGGGTLTDIKEPNPPSSSSSSSSFMKTLSPSIFIILLILTLTILVSVALCLLLRHLNRRCIRHLSTTTTTSTATSSVAAVDSHRHSSRRVSPETTTFSVIDSLPLFTFSSVTRRQSSTNGGDCAVCLSKFEPQDQLRLLPLCCHAFHAHCVDTWLQSNQSCPLCRSAIHASESDLMKASLASSNGGGNGNDSFRLEIGSISRRRAASSDFAEPARNSYSIGSFDYIVEEESEITVSRRSVVSDKDDDSAQPAMEPSLASDVATSGRSWLKDYVDRLSSISSRALSFRSSGRFFTGSSRRSDIEGAGDWDVEANRVGEEISELFRWFSGV